LSWSYAQTVIPEPAALVIWSAIAVLGLKREALAKLAMLKSKEERAATKPKKKTRKKAKR
jgi:hypothetical protein